MRRLITIEDGTRTIYRYVDDRAPQRSDLPLPYVISDIMEPTEQVDGKFYTSKRRFRAVGRALGLIEVGNEKLPPITRSTDKIEVKHARKQAIKKAIDRYRTGHRPPSIARIQG